MDDHTSTSAIGRSGEDAAASLMESEGWEILARNFRAGRGEIDIIAARGDLLAFVEVKRWKRTGPMDLRNAVDAPKIARIIETSKIFLAKYRKYSDKRIRYDVVLLSPDGYPERYEGAFDETV